MSKTSQYYGQVGHVRTFTGKRIQVHLVDRNFGRAFDAKNLRFIGHAEDPVGQAYHKRWKTCYEDSASENESEDSFEQVQEPTSLRTGVCILL
jgi:hypothetical protein